MAGDSYRLLLKRVDGDWRVSQGMVVERAAPGSASGPRERRSGERVEVLGADGKVLASRRLEGLDTLQEVFAPDGSISVEPRNAVVMALPADARAASIRVHSRKGRRLAQWLMDPGRLRRRRRRRRLRILADALDAAPPQMVRLGGPDLAQAKLQLNFIGDGFLEAELPAYHAAVEAFWTRLFQTAPFDRFEDAILGVRMDVISEESGVSFDLTAEHRAAQQGDENTVQSGLTVPPNVNRETPFKATFSQSRLIVVDTVEAEAYVRRNVQTAPASVTVVVANTRLYGGSGADRVPVYSLSSLSADIAIHELGHAAFGLADEYASRGSSLNPPLDEPNVDEDFERSRLKWGHLVNVADADLGVSHPLPGPGPHIGAFEGAKYRPTGAFRPEFDCRMRTVNQPFCAVCREVIAGRLS